jgi:hypothetical protein
MRENQTAIAKLDVQLRTPRLPQLPIERLRAALAQRSKQWKRELRKEPRIARLTVRRLVGPLTVWDEPRPAFIPHVKWTAPEPDYVYWEATPTTELLDGLATLGQPTRLGSSPRGCEQGRRWQPSTFVTGVAA